MTVKGEGAIFFKQRFQQYETITQRNSKFKRREKLGGKKRTGGAGKNISGGRNLQHKTNIRKQHKTPPKGEGVFF